MGNRILVEAISEPLIKQVDRVQMQVEAVQKIDGLFISSKSSSTGIGSFARSTTKLKLHHASEHKLVLEGKNCLIIIDSEKCNRISFPEGLPHGLHIAKSSDAFAILMPRGKGQIMGLLDYDSGMVSIIEFSQRMRTVECCNEYWVTVTAPSRGSSKNECPRVYCADKNGMIKWEKKILYGDFDIWAAKVIIAEDMRNFLVIDLKDMYVFSRAGELERNISMRDFSRAIKHTGFFGTESEHQGQTYIHWQEISFSEYITARSKAFRYDFSTGDYYALRSLRKMVLHRTMLGHQIRAAYTQAADRPVPGIVLTEEFQRFAGNILGEKRGRRQLSLPLKTVQLVVADMDRHRAALQAMPPEPRRHALGQHIDDHLHVFNIHQVAGRGRTVADRLHEALFAGLRHRCGVQSIGEGPQRLAPNAECKFQKMHVPRRQVADGKDRPVVQFVLGGPANIQQFFHR